MEVRAYPSVTVVDGLFPADTLSRLLETRHLPGVSAQDYGRPRSRVCRTPSPAHGVA